MSPTAAPLSVIITGVTGMVGEGVLLECLSHPAVARVLLVARRPTGIAHTKVKELLVPSFLEIDAHAAEVTGYDACFYCAGVSSVGMTEAEYTHITYDTAVHFAEVLAKQNPTMVFVHVSGAATDGTEKGRVMWARVKGRAENALLRLPFKAAYNFRPGFMKPTPGQRNIKGYYRAIGWLYPVLALILPDQVSTMRDVGVAMIHAVTRGYDKHVLEIRDINALAKDAVGDGASVSF